MKIVVLHGSMRKGNTYHMTQSVISQLKEYADVEIEEFSVRDLELPFCVSCHQCFVKGEAVCPHHKALIPLVTALESCDGFVISGAVYVMQLNAAAKNVIDHLAYYFHRPRLFGKKGLVITTTAGAGEKKVANYLKSTIEIWGINNIKNINFKIQNDRFALTEKQQHKLNQTTLLFYKSIKENKLKLPSFNTVAIYNSCRGMSSSTTPISAFDSNYWKETGLIDKVYPYKIGIIKTAFGNLVYTVLKKVMSKNNQV